VVKGKNLKHEGKRRNFDRIYRIDKILYYFITTDYADYMDYMDGNVFDKDGRGDL